MLSHAADVFDLRTDRRLAEEELSQLALPRSGVKPPPVAPALLVDEEDEEVEARCCRARSAEEERLLCEEADDDEEAVRAMADAEVDELLDAVAPVDPVAWMSETDVVERREVMELSCGAAAAALVGS